MTTGNPQIAQGVLNKILGAFQIVNYPALNLTAAFLGKNGIRVATEGATSVNIDTLTGTVPSGEPYIKLSVILPILKTNAIGNAYKTQWETNTYLGDCTIIPDATTLGKIQLLNASIVGFDGMALDGSDPVINVHVQGTYNINSALWG